MNCSVWGFWVAGFCKFWNLSGRSGKFTLLSVALKRKTILSMILSPNMIGCVYLCHVLVSGDSRKFGRMASSKDERRKSLTLAGKFINHEQNFVFDLWHHRDRRWTTLEKHNPGFGFIRWALSSNFHKMPKYLQRTHNPHLFIPDSFFKAPRLVITFLILQSSPVL